MKLSDGHDTPDAPHASSPARTRPSTLADYALHAIREELLTGRWAAGARIQLEDTAAWLEMSPSPVREALRALASEGLVIPQPQRGFRVPEITLEDLEDTYRMRMTLDPIAVHLAAERITAARTEILEARMSELREAYRTGDWADTDRAHRAFHFGIYEVADSPWLIRFLSMLWDNSARYQHLSVPLRGGPNERADAHHAILRACAPAQAADAAELMRKHVERTYRTVDSLLREKRGASVQGDGA